MAYHRTRLCERRRANALKGVTGAAECGGTIAGVNKLRCPFSWLIEWENSRAKAMGGAGEIVWERERESQKAKEREFLCTAALLHPTQDLQGRFSSDIEAKQPMNWIYTESPSLQPSKQKRWSPSVKNILPQQGCKGCINLCHSYATFYIYLFIHASEHNWMSACNFPKCACNQTIVVRNRIQQGQNWAWWNLKKKLEVIPRHISECWFKSKSELRYVYSPTAIRRFFAGGHTSV